MSAELRVASDAESPEFSKGGSNGNGGLLKYRLAELERRMTALEATTRSINETVIRIDEKLSGLSETAASKAYVLTIFGVTGGIAVLTFIGHIVLRAVGSG